MKQVDNQVDNISQPLKHGIARYCAITLLVSGTFVLLAKLGLSFSAKNLDITPIWPPAGFSTVVLFIFGFRYIPAILLGSLIANGVLTGVTAYALAQISMVDTLEGVVAAILLRKMGFKPPMARVHDALALIVATVFGSTVVAATFGTFVYAGEGQLDWSTFWSSWHVYWISNATANLTLAPMLFIWGAPETFTSAQRLRPTWKHFELVLLALTTMIAAYVVWIQGIEGISNGIEYLAFPVLIWAALRFGPRASSVVIVTCSLAAVIGTVRADHFTSGSLQVDLLMAQMFIAVFAITGHLVAGVSEEKAAANRQQKEARDNLEVKVAQRTTDLQQSNVFLQAILDNVSSAIIAVDPAGNITRFNRAAQSLYRILEEYSRPDTWVNGFRLYRPDGKTPLDLEDFPIMRALKGEVISNVEVATRPDDESDIRYLLASGQPLIVGNNEIAGAIVVAHEITDLKRAEMLQELYHHSAVIANEAPDKEQATLSILEKICLYSGWPIGHALEVEAYNESRSAISTDWWYMAEGEIRLKEFKQASSHRFFEGDDLPGRVLSSGRVEWIEIVSESKFPRLKKLGAPTVFSAIGFPVWAGAELVAILEFFTTARVDPDSNLLQTMKFVCDQLGHVYERAHATQRLMKMTLRDPLTGLPNRLAFHDVLRQASAHARRREHYSFAVLFVDLDRFKLINDSLGHAAGDKVILETGRRIQRCLREGDTVARLGGDEFTVLLDDLGCRSDSTQAAKVARRISEEIAKPIRLDREEVSLSCSIGIVIGNHSYQDPDSILRDADSAMYRAKAAGKARFELFSPEMHTQAMNQLRLENDLRRAIEREEFILNYQPIVNLQSGELIGFEALVRWNHPDKTVVLPGDFLSVAEETGIIIPLGQWILTEACGWMAALNKRLAPGKQLSVSVNISGSQFTRSVVSAQVQTALLVSCLEPQCLKLEIVESTLMKNPAAAVISMEALRSLGIEVMIDDFGTGYSSLSYLSRLPIDALKIDRSFVNDMAEMEGKGEVVRSILGMAAALELDVIAEGIETVEQLNALRNFGCTMGQGFFLSRPVSAAAAEALALASAEKPALNLCKD